MNSPASQGEDRINVLNWKAQVGDGARLFDACSGQMLVQEVQDKVTERRSIFHKVALVDAELDS